MRTLKLLTFAAAALAAIALAPIAVCAQSQDIGSAQLLRMPKVGAYPPGAVALNEASGNVAAAAATATLPATAGAMNWLFGFDVFGGGATAASVITCTVSNLPGGTASFSLVIPAGVTTAIAPLNIRFPEPIPASAINTAIAVSCPSFGSGNTNATVNAYGFQTTTQTSP
jgi:hypothetical protein